ncbi:MAG: hypothetical protein KI793_32755 [Rivularia sp. (in: Bacteria)]|nr:hypothetical protein [Rivularia sp. MS3]
MSEQSNAFVQIKEDDSTYVTTDKGTTYISDEMNVALEEVMRQVVNFANYTQSLDPQITQVEAYRILVKVMSNFLAKLEDDTQAKAEILNLIQEFKTNSND